MIALTAEMRAAAARRMGVDDLDPWTVAALVDVLALVARDYRLGPPNVYPPDDAPVHLIDDGSGVTACCERTPFELPHGERLTHLPGHRTCGGAP